MIYILCSGGIVIVVRVAHLHVVHLPRLHIDVSDNGTQLIEVDWLVFVLVN